MAALTGHLQKQAEQSPAASYYNVALLKYQVSTEQGELGPPDPHKAPGGWEALAAPPHPIANPAVLAAGPRRGAAAALRALGLLARCHAGQRRVRLQRRRHGPARGSRQRPRPPARGRAPHQPAAAAHGQLVRGHKGIGGPKHTPRVGAGKITQDNPQGTLSWETGWGREGGGRRGDGVE